MKLILFGATRGTGRQFIEQALAEGHTLTAVVRNPAAFELRHDNLKTVQGDVMDFASVEQALQNYDAVLSAIGSPASKKDTVRSEGTRNIIRAMEKIGVRRLISLSSLGVGESRVMLPFLLKYLIVPLFLRHAFADHEVQEKYIRESRLDWTIIRPAALTDEPLTGIYRDGFPVSEKGLKLKISRADVADFMLKQLNDERYFRQTPGISY
ncbi:MAG: SDR family oxidoreductase [Actinomycetota bacterium]